MAEVTAVPDWASMTSAQVRRWEEVLRSLADVVTPGPRLVVVEGHQDAAVFADRLADMLKSLGQGFARLSDQAPLQDEDAWRSSNGSRAVAIADGPRWYAQPPGQAWDVVIWLRTPPPLSPSPYDERDAHVVVDLHDPAWPIIRHIHSHLADRRSWHLAETRAFFAVRADTWDAKFGADLPAYAQAVAEASFPPGVWSSMSAAAPAARCQHCGRPSGRQAPSSAWTSPNKC